MTRTPRVGLHMIVKDEAHVIERCLASVRPMLAWWVVCDTGSTDGTQDLVRAALADLPGRLLERPWVDFGHNRQEALAAARTLPEARAGDYALWIDADDELVDVPDRVPLLTADGYHIPIRYADLTHDRLALVRLDRPWRWRGVVHEYLYLKDARLDRLEAPWVRARHEGARSRDPLTHRRDAELLQAELERVPDDPRTQFYLGQSWRDAGDDERALAAYRLRVANPQGWDQEQWCARLELAGCLERLGRPSAEVSAAYLEAYAADPGRAEPLVRLAAYERAHERHEVALLYARAAVQVPPPPHDALFVDTPTYTWKALDEAAASCWRTGRFDAGLPAARAALAASPDDERLRVNLQYYLDRDPTLAGG